MTTNLPLQKYRVILEKDQAVPILDMDTRYSEADAEGPLSYTESTSRVYAQTMGKSFRNYYHRRPKPKDEQMHRPTPYFGEVYIPYEEAPLYRAAASWIYGQVGSNTYEQRIAIRHKAFEMLFPVRDRFLGGGYGWEGYHNSGFPLDMYTTRLVSLFETAGRANDWEPLVDASEIRGSEAWQIFEAFSSMTLGDNHLLGRWATDEGLDDLLATQMALAKSKAASRLSQGDVNLGVFLAEVGEGAGTIMSLLYRLYEFFRCLIRFDLSGAFRALRLKPTRRQRELIAKRKARGLEHEEYYVSKQLANWDDYVLEFQFGLKPLMSDLYGMYESYLSSFRTVGELVHVHVNSMSHDEISDFVNWRWGKEFKLNPAYAKNVSDNQVGVQYDLTYRVTDPGLRTLQEMGLLNPLEVAWEKVPFSFLVDWIINFGEIIQSTTAEAGVEFLHGSETRYRLGPICFTDSDVEQANAQFHQAFIMQGAVEDTLTEVFIPPVNVCAKLECDRRVLENDFSLAFDFTNLRAKVNPFTSVSRWASFLALVSKGIQAWR